MSTKIKTSNTSLDTSGSNNTADFLPAYYQTDANKKFLHSTLSQLTQPGSVKKVSGHIGRMTAKATTHDEVFIEAPTTVRQNYQLEPGFVINDTLDNTSYFKDYQDYINQIGVFGGNVSNHSRLNSQEMYSWDPHFDWDKFVNFQNYYWLPNGPDTVIINKVKLNDPNNTYYVKSSSTYNSYIFTPNGLTNNPSIKLYRGQTYTFHIDSPKNPFNFKELRTTGSLDRYSHVDLVTDVYRKDANGELVLDAQGKPLMEYAITKGTFTFKVPSNAPNRLYYVSEVDLDFSGIIDILDLDDSSDFDVSFEILGRQTYTLVDGTKLSNGMKVRFLGDVTPSLYASGNFYVEGVGQSIQLIPESQLEVITPYTTSKTMLFDNELFDTQPFNDAISYSGTPDYILINRASRDKNFWSRNNHWFHIDVITQSALHNGIQPAIDQSMRAVRPIIEFEKNLKLFNFGTYAIDDIAAIDQTTVDAFSLVEGSLGYAVDGVPLVHGQHVIFTADPDILVKNNIYRVDFIDVKHIEGSHNTSVIGTVGSVIPEGLGWRAIITGMTSTSGLDVGMSITATPDTGDLGGVTIGSAIITRVISSSSVEYIVISESKPKEGSIKNIINLLSTKQIHLVLVSAPKVNQVVLVHQGIKAQGSMFWYDGISWNKCQQKTTVNQVPLFDVVDSNGISFGNKNEYVGTTFAGTSIFSYKQNSLGTNDKALGFPLSYKNINNIGDIVFNFPLITDSFLYDQSGKTISKSIDTGFLIVANETLEYVNGWKKCIVNNTQPAIRLYRNSNLTNNFKIDIFDNLPDLLDLTVYVYVNNQRTKLWKFRSSTVVEGIETPLRYHEIVFDTDVALTDSVLIKVYSNISINKNGYYEIPVNLQNNPMNGTLTEFTLGEVIDHVDSIVDHIFYNVFSGDFPGKNNLRDIGNVTGYGTKFVQHSGSLGLSLYHITSDSNNIIKALESARDDYSRFKRAFMTTASSLGVTTHPAAHVDLILQSLAKNIPPTSPYYFSDMAPYGAKVITNFTIGIYNSGSFSLSQTFTLNELSNKAVGVYLNEDQLLYGRDYTFSDQGFVVITATMVVDDVVTIYEYENTDGCLIPATPTKLGMWPKYQPKKYLDTTFTTPKEVIQGHDGSIVVAYNDYRDDLILELEKRIYNNIKVEYDESLFNIHDIIPSYNYETAYSLAEFNNILLPNFYLWSAQTGLDFSTSLTFKRNNSFTYVYDLKMPFQTPTFWRGIYQWVLGTDRPHLCPWEMLGLSVEPLWWVSVYGPAPYTSGNLVLWEDISNGLIKDPDAPRVVTRYIRKYLLASIPVDEYGNLLSPADVGLLSCRSYDRTSAGDFTFGDVSPVEAAWRRHSHYPFSVIKTSILMTPAKTIGVLLDRSRIKRNKINQIVYFPNEVRLKVSDVILPSIYLHTSRTQTAGLVNYLVDYLNCESVEQYNTYKENLKLLSPNLSYRVSGFTSKEKFNLLLDSKSPTSQGSVFIPTEDYKVILNTSSPISLITYSGVIITRVSNGFEIKGYSQVQPFFKYFKPQTSSGYSVTIGGISEGYMIWTNEQTYAAGNIVQYNGIYYRVTQSHVSTFVFDLEKVAKLDALPVVGGATATIKTTWNTSVAYTMPYNFKLKSPQDVVDFLLGYGEWLKSQGFEFQQLSKNLNVIVNWETSAKEFLFWTTQNWASDQLSYITWEEWVSGSTYSFGTIVRYNGDYYKVQENINGDLIFNDSKFLMLSYTDLTGSSVISLSPGSTNLTFKAVLSVVDSIINPKNVYELLDGNGLPFDHHSITTYRYDNKVQYTPTNNSGIYCATFYLIQKEHVVILNNTTMFNDTIYNPESGYKQDKIKVSGFVSEYWNGTLNIPGFVVDQAVIKEWSPWQDYTLGDVVKHKSFYYSAIEFISGSETFDDTKWVIVKNKPEPRLLPNWNYKAAQFSDFYSLDSENFDIEQQRMAQHLTGYQKRQYLENIIQDDVSEFKFYQGMIIEKGTQNVLNKLFDVLSSDNQSSLKFYEEWAIRLGQYGASSAFENIEFVLDEALFKTNPQGFKLTDNFEKTDDLVIRQSAADIYLKPFGYTSNIWPKAQTVENSSIYARYDEATKKLKMLSDIVNVDISTYSYNEYVICTFDANNDWCVYQYMPSNLTVTNSVRTSGGLSITVAEPIMFADPDPASIYSDYIGIKTSDSTLIGFFKAERVNTHTFSIIKSGQGVIPSGVTTSIGVFVKRRVSKFDNTTYQISDVTSGSLLWTNNANEKWKTWVYHPVYKNVPITINDSQITEFGRDTAIDVDGSIMAVSTTTLLNLPQPNGTFQVTRTGVVLIYERDIKSSVWGLKQTLKNPFYRSSISMNQAINICKVVGMSPTGTWLAVGSPVAGNLSSQGIVSIFKRDLNGVYELVKNVQSPYPVVNEKFGSTLTFNNDLLLVGTAVGRIYKLKYDVSVRIETHYNPQGSIGNILTISETTNIVPNMIVSGRGFNGNQRVESIVDSREIIISNIPSSTPTGIIQFMRIFAETPYDPVGSIGDTLVVGSTANVTVGMTVKGNGFNGNQQVVAVVNSKTVILSSPPVFRPSKNLQFVTYPVSATYDPVGSFSTTVVVSSTEGILPNMVLVGDGFNGTQRVVSIVDSKQVTLDSNPVSRPRGIIEFLTYDWIVMTDGPLAASDGTSTYYSPQYGADVAVSDSGVIVVSEPYQILNNQNIGNGKVYVYNSSYNLVGVIEGPPDIDYFGNSISISRNAEYIAISGLKSSEPTGVVYIYKFGFLEMPWKVISNLTPTLFRNFGNYVQFINDYKTLIISSAAKLPISGQTIPTTASGVVDIFDIYEQTWIFSERLERPAPNTNGYGYKLVTTSNSVIVSAPYEYFNAHQTGIIYEYTKSVNAYSWTVKNYAIDRPDVKKIKQAFLYNRVSNKLIEYIDVIDPIHGKYPKVAEQELKFKSVYDPAVYTTSTLSGINVDAGLAWSTEKVGVLWWDLKTTKFIDNYTDNVVYRNSTLSTLAYGATVDIYEWVETRLKPSDWDSEADTNAGLAAGISGKSLYGDAVYTEVKRYDAISRRYISTYYYWVKNKSTIPAITGRSLSAYEVSTIISNPRGEGYKFLSLTGLDSFSLVNVKSDLSRADVVLSVEYWLPGVTKTDQNIHTEWKLISEAPLTKLPAAIESKWIDSLCGKDLQDRLVPDELLPIKLRYGIENRPRQGMFVNRFEAIKQVIEQTNLVLKQHQIVDKCDLSKLQKFDSAPSVLSGMYDVIVDTYLDLQFESANYYIPPVVRPIVENGHITGIIIDFPGKGYVNPPYIKVIGNGKNAKIKSTINSLGQITGCEIINQGEGYTSSTVLTVRSYAALVISDMYTNDGWCVYSYDPMSDIWSKVISQTYDVRKYWDKIDWYEAPYSKFTNIDFLVGTYSDLNTIKPKIGDKVKVQVTSDNRWVLLEKYQDSTSYDWTQSYKVIGSQNGTIKFSKLLYDFIGSPIGYDGSLYDNDVYDNCAAIEMRIILTAIKDDLLILEELKTEYLKLFFTSVRYAMSEQTYIDWIFKTSFVNVTHNVGNLRNAITYKNDNLSNFEDYVSEVKPYRTQIREYISSYNKQETASLMISDFDLPAIYDNERKTLTSVDVTVVGETVTNINSLTTEPWKSWASHLGFSVTDIKLIDGGSGYITEPTITITSKSGKGATARAFISNGRVTRIKLLTSGSGYIKTPTIIIDGGIEHTGTHARVSVVLGDGLVRSNLTKLKFDRITQTMLVTDLSHTDQLVNVNGSKVQFELAWPPNLQIGKTTVTINGAIEIRDNYKLQVAVNSIGEYSGTITFNTAPKANSIITVTYLKNVVLLNAVDRISHYYNPQVGDLGKDLAQLMTGIDYGGVVVSGLAFSASNGWGMTGFSSGKWDHTASVSRYKVTIPRDEYRIPLPFIPKDGAKLAIYYDNGSGAQPVRIDDPYFGVAKDLTDDTVPYQTNESAVMVTPKGTGHEYVVEIPKWFTHDNDSYTFIVQDETSDGSEETNDYDVSLNGGTFEYLSASGLVAEDIIIDGDKFDASFAGPEEVVPGHVVDALAIRVYVKNSGGAFMQFKDMLNRVTYKRLSARKQTKLKKPLKSTDTTITLVSGANFEVPDPLRNIPGIVYINSERIEYFTINNNVLGQLRRGTMGTGIPDVHPTGTYIQEIGTTETIPYEETNSVYQTRLADDTISIKSDSDTAYGASIVVSLPFIPNKSKTTWTYSEGIPADYGQCDEVEVYIGGYNYGTQWVANAEYFINDVVTIGSYVYKCVTDHISSVSFSTDFNTDVTKSKWVFFVGNIRLQKAPYTVYNERYVSVTNPTGAKQFPADFSVNGKYQEIRISNTFNLAQNTVITVVKNSGHTWSDTNSLWSDTDPAVVFIQAVSQAVVS